MGLSELCFPHVCVIGYTHSLAHADFLTQIFASCSAQMDLSLDEKATYGESHVIEPHIPMYLGRRLMQGTHCSCISFS